MAWMTLGWLVSRKIERKFSSETRGGIRGGGGVKGARAPSAAF